MFRRFWAGAACLLVTQAWGLDDASQKLADRYLAVLAANPTQTVAFDRLWKIYADAGETAQLLTLAQEKSREYPLLAARLLEKGDRRNEARAVLEPLVRQNRAVADLLIQWIEQADGPLAAAQAWAKWDLPDAEAWLRLGELWSRSDRPREAQQAWRRSVEAAPHDLTLRGRLASALSASGDTDAALNHLAVIASEGTPAERLAAWEEIATLARRAQRWDEAITAQEALLKMFSPGHWKRAETQRQLVALYEKADRLPELEARWVKEAEAQDPAAIRQLIAYYSGKQDDAGQRRWLREAVKLSPRDTDLLSQLARSELDAGDLPAAATMAERLKALQPGNADTIFLLAEIAALRGDEVLATRSISGFLETHPDEAAQLRAQAFYERLRLFHPLESSLQKAVAQDPKNEASVIELTRFYLRQKRYPEAVAALEHFPTAESARVGMAFAGVLREAKLDEDALRWAQRAWEATPDLETALFTAELLDAVERRGEARSLIEQAAKLPKLPSEASDRRLFTALRAHPSEDETAQPVRDLIGHFQKAAIDDGGEEAWLRLVRWRRWNDEPVAAEESCLAGLKQFPGSQSLQNALADLMVASGNIDGAIPALRRLAEIAPDRASEIERRIGHLELDRGRPEEAEKIFAVLLRNDPADWQALADVAISQQTAGDWFEALETWTKVWELAPPDRRRTIRSSILGAVARLQLQARGLAFLEQAILQERDPAARSELLRDAATFAREQNVLDAWQEVLTKRLQEREAPAFLREGLASVLRERGQFSEARGVLADQDGPSDGATWEFLLKTAEQEGNLVEAAKWAGRLARQSVPPNGAAWLRYAALQEQAGQWTEARETWETLVHRFARDPAVLLAAGDFFHRRGEQELAENYRRAAVNLESASLATMLDLGRAALARSDRDQAAKDFERLLASSQADRTMYEDSVPWPLPTPLPPGTMMPGELRAGGFPRQAEWTVPSESNEEGCRLLAIKELARLLANSPHKGAWLKSFTHPAELLWATYFSGDVDRALQILQKRKPMPETEFVLLALESGNAETLAAWAEAEPERWTAVLTGLGFLIDQGWTLRPEIIKATFGRAEGIRRWEVAQLLAERRHYRLASDFAEGVPASLPDTLAAQVDLEVAEWQVALRRPLHARESLDESLKRGSPELGFATPFFSALQARWQLTPEGERSAFRQAMDKRMKGELPKNAALVRALLAALSGENDLAREELQAAFPATSSVAGQRWLETFQQGGARLEQWELHRFARDLYRLALARDRALARLRDEHYRNLTEGSFLQSNLFTASPEFARYLTSEWKARRPSQEELLMSARRLLASGQDQKAAEIIAMLTREDPGSDAVVMGLTALTPYRFLARDLGAYTERVLNRANGTPLSKSLAVQAGMRLAGMAHQDSDFQKELALLEILQADPSPAVALSRSQALARLGRHREALSVLEKASVAGDVAPYSLALAELYSGLGREREAVGLLRRQLKATSPLRYAAASRLRELATLLGETEALAAAEKVLADAPAAQVHRVREDWPQALASLDQKFPAPAERFAAGASFLLGQSELPEGLRTQELRRLESLVQDSPDLASRYYVFRTNLSRQRGTLPSWEQELIPQWKTGSYFAGEILLQLYLEQGRQAELEAILDDYLTSPNFREIAWLQLARDLLQRGHNRLAERVLLALQLHSDGDADRDLLLAEAIQKQGRPVADLIAPVEALVPINPALRLPLARYYLAVDDLDQARNHLDRCSGAEALDAEIAPIWQKLAERQLQAGRLDEARQALSESLRRQPSAGAVDLVGRYYRAINRAPVAGEYPLTPTEFAEVRALFIEGLLERENNEAALALYESDPGAFLSTAELRAALQRIEVKDWARTARLWAQVENQSPSWNVQAAAAQFHARRAAMLEKTDDLYLSELTLAHKLDPGNFSLASDLTNELVRRGRTAQAAKVLELAAKSFGSVSDRLAIRKMQESLQMTPPLPKGS